MSRHKHHPQTAQPAHPTGTPTGAPATDETEERLQHNGVTFEEAVRVRAYHKWELAGRPDGDGLPFWLEAQAELAAV